jgi:hypothetical protein
LPFGHLKLEEFARPLGCADRPEKKDKQLPDESQEWGKTKLSFLNFQNWLDFNPRASPRQEDRLGQNGFH